MSAVDLTSLARRIEGEVLTDELSRRLYATDASPYQQLPLAVARPSNRGDCTAIVEFCAERRLPLIPRAAGTSLAGQCVGEGLVVDTARHMTAIGELDSAERRVRVQPGAVLTDLNDHLHPRGLMFGPDPSTADRCTVGGMIGNNAWGARAPRYGTTRDCVHEVEAVLSDGSVARFGPIANETLAHKVSLDNLEGEIYRGLWQLIEMHRPQIQTAPPPAGGCNSGYALHDLACTRPWQADGPPFNLAPFLCGTEGTLALITEATLKLAPLPARRALICAHFDDLHEAVRAVAPVVGHAPHAVELLDRHILMRTRGNLLQRRNRFWIEPPPSGGDPAAVLLIEFQHEDPGALEAQVQEVVEYLRRAGFGYAHPVVDESASERVWALRKAGLGLLMGLPGKAKPVAGIEDAAVPIACLAEYTRAVADLMRRHEIDCVYYGSVSRGLLHLRPLLDLARDAQRRKFIAVLDAVADLVAEFGGCFSSKHGDGRLRSGHLKRLLGEPMYGLLNEVKHLFDPREIFNPHKLFDPPSVIRDLRYPPSGDQLRAVPAGFDWGPDRNLLDAAERCNGAGVCLQRAGRGTMCPSYMATREERHGTRGRANTLRQMAGGEAPFEALTGEEVAEVLDLCLACKGCKAECPASVDVAQMKAEVLQLRHERYGTPWRARWLGQFERVCRAASVVPGAANAVLASRAFRRLAGLDAEKDLPRFAPRRFSEWFAEHRPHPNAGRQGRAVLIVDPWTEYFDPATGRAAVGVLEAAGYRLRPERLDSGRVQISQGLLQGARQRIESALDVLYPPAREDLPLIGLEPSELLTLRDEAPSLIAPRRRGEVETVAQQAVLFEEFIGHPERDLSLLSLTAPSVPILLHVHCHQRALSGTEPAVNAMQRIPDARVEVIPSGCCGMAGAFGYEREHAAVSRQIAELVLFPAIRARSDAWFAVTGNSCRQQIAAGLQKETFHPAGILHRAMR